MVFPPTTNNRLAQICFLLVLCLHYPRAELAYGCAANSLTVGSTVLVENGVIATASSQPTDGN